MSNIRIIAENYIDNSSLSAVPALALNLDENNLKLPGRSNVTRTVDTAPQEISGTFNEVKEVSSLVIGRHNLPLLTTYRLRLYSDVNSEAQVYDSGAIDVAADEIGSNLWAWGDFIWGATAFGADKQIEAFSPKANLVLWIPTVSAQSFKLDIALPLGSIPGMIPFNGGFIPLVPASGVASHIEIGRLIIGKYIEPTYNISLNHSLSWEETTKQFRTDAGSLRSDISLPNRQMDFSIGTMNEADRTTIQNALRFVGMRKDFFISLFPLDKDKQKTIDYSGIVKLTKIPRYVEYAPSYYKSKYTVQEV